MFQLARFLHSCEPLKAPRRHQRRREILPFQSSHPGTFWDMGSGHPRIIMDYLWQFEAILRNSQSFKASKLNPVDPAHRYKQRI